MILRFLIRRLGPWGWVLLLLQALRTTQQHLQRTSPEDRARLGALVSKSGGRPGRLTPQERHEFVETARRLKPGRLLRSLVVSVFRPGRVLRSAR